MDNFLERINNEANTQFTKAQASFEQFYKKENQAESDQNQQAEPIQTILYPGTLKTNQIYTIEGYQVQLLKFLAEGTYAHVYLAAVTQMPVDLKLNSNKMVLKRVVISDNNELEKLKNEIKFMKSLSGNMNIVDYYASTIHPLRDGSGSYEAFILMEYCSDGTLFDLMKSREPVFFNEKEILFLFHDICMGVAAMHYHEPAIVHRDIKVENVLISYNKRFKLCDFGSGTTEIIPPNTSLPVAKATQLEIELDSCTTLQYRAPETIDLYMRRGLGEKMDIWALGILLYKLCYFITPFEEVGKLAILNCKFEFPAKPMIPNPILKLINDMLQEDPLQRPNIYQIVLQVSKLRNVPCNLKEVIITFYFIKIHLIKIK
ncbi:kinase-like protein [Neoconidiobolus thromboides FSU 785]|nr:kinase-like protein [Neoconidiobolus thromboides FSU 785]